MTSYRITITRYGDDQELIYADSWADVTEKLDNASTWAFDNGHVMIERITDELRERNTRVPEFEPEEEDGDYLDSLERFDIDGRHYYEPDDMDFVDAQFFQHDF